MERGFGLVHVLVVLVLLVGGGIGVSKYKKHQQAEEARVAAEKDKAALSASLKKLQAIFARWDDAQKVAGNAPRIALPPQIERLQGIRRELDGSQVHPCLAPAKSSLSAGMSSAIDGLVAFLGSSGDDGAGSVDAFHHFGAAKEGFDGYADAVVECFPPEK